MRQTAEGKAQAFCRTFRPSIRRLPGASPGALQTASVPVACPARLASHKKNVALA